MKRAAVLIALALIAAAKTVDNSQGSNSDKWICTGG